MQEQNWSNFFLSEKQKPYFSKLQEQLDKDYLNLEITPLKSDIYSAFNYPLKDIKVVIIGQDPYPEKGVADGLAFSANGSEIPVSLRNIFKEIEFEYGYKNTSPKLTYLAQQGVFLLNAFLTTKVGEPLFHKNIGWDFFTKNAITYLNEYRKNLVFMLFGKFAKTNFLSLIDQEKHLVLQTSHPSFFSFYKGFYGSNVFKKANGYLKKNNLPEINWLQQWMN